MLYYLPAPGFTLIICVQKLIGVRGVIKISKKRLKELLRQI